MEKPQIFLLTNIISGVIITPVNIIYVVHRGRLKMIRSNSLELYLPDTVFNNTGGKISLDSVRNIILHKAKAKGLSLFAKTDTIKSSGFLPSKSEPCVVFFNSNQYEASIKMVVKVAQHGDKVTISAGVTQEDESFFARLKKRFFKSSYIKENYFKEALNEKYTDFFDETVSELFGKTYQI